MIDLLKLPETPTDNLYKFVAIFGLTLFVVGLTLYGYLSYLNSVNQADIVAKQRVITTDMALSEDLATVKDIIEGRLKMPLENQQDKDKMRAFLVKNGELIDMSNKLSAGQPYLNYASIALATTAFFGVVLMIVGFSLWYTKLQKYQDIIVKNQADTAKKAISVEGEIPNSTDSKQSSD